MRFFHSFGRILLFIQISFLSRISKKQVIHPIYHLFQALLNSLLFFFLLLHHLPNCLKILFQQSHVDLLGTYLLIISFNHSNLPNHKSSQEQRSNQDRWTKLQPISISLPADAWYTFPIEGLQTTIPFYTSPQFNTSTIHQEQLLAGLLQLGDEEKQAAAVMRELQGLEVIEESLVLVVKQV